MEYIYGDDLISQERGGADYCYLYDGQMSTRQLVDENEDVANTYTYDAFGIVIDQAGVVANHYMYTGEQYDPNAGFYYLRARYYDQHLGRLLTTDPFEGILFEPKSLHKYIYAGMNPVIFVDPDGLMMSLIEAVSAMGMEKNLKELEWGNKVRSTRRKFRGYCRWAASNTKKIIKGYSELRKMTAKTKFASHHVIQDWAMKAYFGAQYSSGIGMCMPVLGKYGQRFSPHWIMNSVQRRNKSSEDFLGVARIALEAAGCRNEDAKSIIKFIAESEDMVDLFVP